MSTSMSPAVQTQDDLFAGVQHQYMDGIKERLPCVQDADEYLAEKGWQLKSSMGYRDMAEAYARGIPYNIDLSGRKDALVGEDDYTSYIEAYALMQ